MKTLLIMPIQEEIHAFLQACVERDLETVEGNVGKLSTVSIPTLGLTLAPGGLGKVQFAVQTQYLLDACTDWDLVICVGAAGALVDGLSVGDVVVSTDTVEHDIRNHFGEPLLPRFPSASTIVDRLRRVKLPPGSVKVHFGTIASGDEDVVNSERKKLLHQETGALAVAWEGAGGARACQFSQVPFVEIRGITDSADSDAAVDFDTNLKVAMRNTASLIVAWLEKRTNQHRDRCCSQTSSSYI